MHLAFSRVFRVWLAGGCVLGLAGLLLSATDAGAARGGRRFRVPRAEAGTLADPSPSHSPPALAVSLLNGGPSGAGSALVANDPLLTISELNPRVQPNAPLFSIDSPAAVDEDVATARVGDRSAPLDAGIAAVAAELYVYGSELQALADEQEAHAGTFSATRGATLSQAFNGNGPSDSRDSAGLQVVYSGGDLLTALSNSAFGMRNASAPEATSLVLMGTAAVAFLTRVNRFRKPHENRIRVI